MATLTQNVYRAINDFNSIENAIVGKGVPVPAGTPTSEYAEKVEDVFEAGKKSEYDAFWDAFQNYGNRNKYEFAFTGAGEGSSGGWTDETFKPKYDIILGEGHTIQRIFWNSTVSDVPSVLEKQGIVFDTTRATWWQQCFQTSKSNRWGVLNASNATYFSHVFSTSSCVTIEKLIVSETVPFANAFDNASRLTNLTIEGTIGQNGFNVSWSPLNKASLTSIINALSSTTTGLTATLRLAAVNTAFETTAGAADGSTSDEWTALIATKPNWTINLINS